MTAQIPCGHGSVSLPWDSGIFPAVRLLETRNPVPLDQLGQAVSRALSDPIGCVPLAVRAQGKRSACIVVSDATRPVPNRALLPPILKIIEAAGIPREAVTLLVATGMHRASTSGERLELLGPEIVRAYRVVDHDCRNQSALQRVEGTGNPFVEVNRRFCEAELRILTGLIEPHGFAGYSGGGKAILPGLASFDTMRQLHSFAMVEDPNVDFARIDDNPFRKLIDTVSRTVGVDCIVNVVLDRQHRACGVFAGDVVEAHRAGCRLAASHQVVQVPEAADLVVTCGGGFPSDATLYQATKGLFAARHLVREGGTILFVAGCEQGLGSSSFSDLVHSAPSPEAFRTRYRDPTHFVIDQWAAQAYYQVRERVDRILFHSPHLSRNQVESFGMEQVTDPEAVFKELLSSHSSAYVVPEGPHLVGVVRAEAGRAPGISP